MYIRSFLYLFFLTTVVTVQAQTLDEGIKYLDEEQFPKAKKTFLDILKSTPANAQACYYLGELYYVMEDEDSANYYYNKGITADAQYPMNYVGLGKITLEKDYLEGRKNFDKALQLSKSRETQALVAIASYFTDSDKQDLTQAKIFLDKALKSNPQNPQVFLAFGDYYWALNDGSKALAEYDKAKAINAKLPEAYLKIGKLYSRARNYDLGLDFYKKGLAIDSSYGPFYREMGELYYKAKKYDKAINNYKKYVEKTGENAETLYRYGSFLFMSNDYKGSVQVLNKVISFPDFSNVAYRLLGYSYYEIGDYTQGLRSMDELFVKLDSKKIIASDYSYYGRLLAKTGKDSLALLNLNKAVSLDTSNTALYGDIGNIYYTQKKFGEASMAYSKKVQAKGATLQDYLNLGKSYYFNKDYTKADSVFAKFIELKPAMTQGYLWRARTATMIDPESTQGLAEPFYEKYVELAGSDVEKNRADLVIAYSYLGYYYLQINKDNLKSIAAWKKVKEFDPGNKKADDALKILDKK